MGSERGQGTVEWVGLTLLVSALMLTAVAAGVRVPGATLARALADRLLCAASLADGCGDEPALIAAYGSEVAKLVRQHMPMLAFESGSTAVPVDFRRCRVTACSDVAEEGPFHKTDEGLPITAFAHVIDCREGETERADAGADCSGNRAGNLYIQYWTYYPDSATLRELIGERGYHEDDWESVQFRVAPDGSADQRASSHHGYNYFRSDTNWMSDAGITPHDGWGPETGLLIVSGGSHAGAAAGNAGNRGYVPGERVHLVPLEQLSAETDAPFSVSPPWSKKVWLDPEYQGTD